jgi:4-diphosphocytidyl-2-C-methyl-D-erythritol kinase
MRARQENMETRPQFTQIENGLLVRAPGKINLSLLIAGKRPDGYHEIETIMAKIALYDELLIKPSHGGGIQFRCQGPHWAPDGPDNLVVRTARLLLDACGLQEGLDITLIKNMPAGSGLGSASSDAAATLMGVARLLHLDLTAHQQVRLAAQLGSDVAFFLGGPLALCTGRGEKVRPLDARYDFTALLVIPSVNVSTARVYANYLHDADLYRRHHDRIASLLSENRIDAVAQMGINMLAGVCFTLESDLAMLKSRIEKLGFGPLCLTGSGSGLFEIIPGGDAALARRRQQVIREEIGCPSLIVTNNGW